LTVSARRHNVLITFGALSLALHVLLLAGPRHHALESPPRLGDARSNSGEIVIALASPAQPKPRGTAAHLRATSGTLSAGHRTNDPVEHQPPDLAPDGEASAAAIVGEVSSRLTRYLTYPPLARARHWEGTVLVGFRLGSDGQLNAIRVARSSGYDILDASALDSLSKVGRLNDVNRLAAVPARQLELAVMYRLKPR